MMDDFIRGLGPPFMAHLLRRLYDDFVASIEQWYAEIGVQAPARTHSTMLALEQQSMGVVELAAQLRQSHPLVLLWLKQLKKLGFVEAQDHPSDKRRTVLSLTDSGRVEIERHRRADRIIGETYEALMREADAPVFDALWRIEQACRDRPFIERLRLQAKDSGRLPLSSPS